MRASDALSSGTCGRLPAASMSPLARQNDQIGAPAEGLYGVTICAQIGGDVRANADQRLSRTVTQFQARRRAAD